MKHKLIAPAGLAISLVLQILLPSTLLSEPSNSDIIQPTEAALRKVISRYFEGRKKADINLLRTAFSKNAWLQTINEKGEHQLISLEEYFDLVRQQGAVSVNTRINHLRIDQTLGFAKVTFDYSDKVYVDHLSMMKIQGDWKIVIKSFQKIKTLKH